MAKKDYKVYLIKDRHTDVTVYVGLTRTTLHKRFLGHVSRKKDLITHSNHRIELVHDDLSQAEAVTLEEMLIEQYQTREVGFNISPKSINEYSNAHSEEQKLKWKQERKGIKVSAEHAEKNRIARLGLKSSHEHKTKIGEANSKSIICLNTGKVYKSAREAAKDLGVSYCRISEVCNGKRPHTHGYRFKFLSVNSL